MSIFTGLGDEIKTQPLVDEAADEPLRNLPTERPSENPFAGLGDEIEGSTLTPVMTEAMNEDPDRYANAVKISKDFNTTPEIVQPTVEEFEKQVKLDKMHLDKMSQDFAVTGRFLSKFDNAAVAHDDIDTLTSLEEVQSKTWWERENEAALEQSVDIMETGWGRFLTTDVPNKAKSFGASGIARAEKTVAGAIEAFLGGITESYRKELGTPIEGREDAFNDWVLAGHKQAVKDLSPLYQEAEMVLKQVGIDAPMTTKGGELLSGAIDSIFAQAPGLAVGVITGNPALAVSLMGIQTYGQTYADSIAQGMSPEDAHKNAAIQGLTESATELIPFIKFAGILNPGKKLTREMLEQAVRGELKPGKKMGRKLAEYMLAEFPGEALATAIQESSQKYFSEPDPEKRMQQVSDYMFSHEWTQDQIDTFLQTAVQTAIMGSAGRTGNLVIDRLQRIGEDQDTRQKFEQAMSDQMKKTQVEQKKINQINETVKQSKLKTRDPETLRQFGQQITGEDDKVYISGEGLKEFFEQNQIDPAETPAFQQVADQVNEAAALGTAVEMPMSDYIADIATNDQYAEGLRDHVRLSNETMSISETEKAVKEQQAFHEELIARAEENADLHQESKMIYQDAMDQLKAAGKASPQVIKQQAEIIPAYVTRLASETGVRPAEIYQQMGLTIRGPFAEQQAEQQARAAELGVDLLQNGQVYNQTGQLQTDTPQFKAWFGDSKVVDEQGQPLVVYHGSPDVRGILSEGFRASMTRGDMFFFSSDYGVADTYADDTRAFDYQNAEPFTIPLYVTLKNPMVIDAKGQQWRETEKHIQEAKSAGHDGVIIKNSRDEYSTPTGGKVSDVYVAFDPTQIKSAMTSTLKSRVDGTDIGGGPNIGTFDPNDPNILKQTAQAIKATEKAEEIKTGNQGQLVVDLEGMVEAESIGLTNQYPEIRANRLLYSRETFEKGVQEGYYDELLGVLIQNGYEPTKAQKFIQDITSISNLIFNNQGVLDYESHGNGVFSAIKDNSDAQYMKSEDYTTICRKTLKMVGTLSEIMKQQKRSLTADDMASIRDMLRNEKEIVNCGICYVFSRWMQIGNSLDQMAHRDIFIQAEQARVQAKVKKGKADPITDEQAGAMWDELFGDVPQEVIYDLNRRHEFARDYPKAAKWLRQRGAGLGKALETRTAYVPGLLEKEFTPEKVKTQNLFSGMRMQSWSDFDPLHIIDMMQVAAERAKIGLAAHAYTKVPDFVRVMAPTGVFVNMSLIPKGSGFNEDGTLAFDPVEGMPIEDAMELRSKYPTAGTICIGISDEHIRALLDDPRIDYVIPYHSSGLPKSLQKELGEDWADYEKTQTDKAIDKEKMATRLKRIQKTIKSKQRAEHIMAWEWWDKNATPQENSENFYRYAEESGVKPRFSEFRDHPNAYKLMIDRKMVDDNGKYMEQKPTTLDFDMDAISEIFQNYIDAPIEETTEGLAQPNMNVVNRWLSRTGMRQDGGRVKGYFDPTQNFIQLTEAADVSTFLHESAHFFLEMERRFNPKGVEAINQWFFDNAAEIAGRVEGMTQSDVEEAILTEMNPEVNRAAHEFFAESFEVYLSEGKAPSPELRTAFASFKRWLVDLWKRIKGPQLKLDDQGRQMFDRLLATQDQIAAAEAINQMKPLFTDAAMAGMTDEEFADYQERAQAPTEKAETTLYEKMLKEVTRQTEEWWKDEMVERTLAAAKEIQNQPIYIAAEILRLKDGDIKFDREEIKEFLGIKNISKEAPWLNRMTVTKDGKPMDLVAEELGYSAGEELLLELMDATPVKELARKQAEAEMLDEYGDIMNDGTLEQAAQEAVYNEKRGELILFEMKQLAKNQNRPAIDRQIIKQLAKENIGRLSLNKISPSKYRRAEIKSALAAQAATAVGNRALALNHKTQQAMNFYLWKEATAARERANVIVRYTKKFGKKRIRESLAKAGNEYLEQIDGILNRFEFIKTMKAFGKERSDIRDWIEERRAAGEEIDLSPEVSSEQFRQHYKEIPYDSLLGVYDSLRNIDHVARFARKIKLNEEMLDFQEAAQKLIAEIEKQSEVYTPSNLDAQKNKLGRAKSSFRKWIANQTKMSMLFTWLDGGNKNGLVHQMMFQPFTDAADGYHKWHNEVSKPIQEAVNARSKDDIKRHGHLYHIKETVSRDADGQIVNDGNYYGSQILTVALNTGNLSNLEKMLKGEGWIPQDAPAEMITIENPKLRAVLSKMTKSDWELVQLIWDNVNKLYEPMNEVYRRNSGISLPKVEAQSITVQPADGDPMELRGGYYPVVYDPYRSNRAEKFEEKKQVDIDNIFGGAGGMLRPSVTAGATNERTKATGPIRFDFSVIPNHINEVILYITHHEAVRQVYTLIEDKKVSAAIKSRIGVEEFNNIKPWINAVAKNGRESNIKGDYGFGVNTLRFGMTIGIMGFKVGTTVKQLFGLSPTVGEIGIRNMRKGMTTVYSALGNKRQMTEMWDFVNQRSKIMAHRIKTMDRELTNASNAMKDREGFLKKMQEVSMLPIAYMQVYGVDLPSWYGAYAKGVEDGHQQLDPENYKNYAEFEKAVDLHASQYADKVVELYQGSSAIKDTSRLMREDNAFVKATTMFMTYFSSMYNVQRDLYRGAKTGRYNKSQIAARMLFIYALPVLFDTLIGHDWDDDDESFMTDFGMNLALYPFQVFPLIRGVASKVAMGYGFTASPVIQLVDKGAGSAANMLSDLFTGEEISTTDVKNTAKLIGAASGVPGVSQIINSGTHLYETLEEGEDFSIMKFLF